MAPLRVKKVAREGREEGDEGRELLREGEARERLVTHGGLTDKLSRSDIDNVLSLGVVLVKGLMGVGRGELRRPNRPPMGAGWVRGVSINIPSCTLLLINAYASLLS